MSNACVKCCGSGLNSARGSEQQCVSTVVYLFRTMVGMALRRDVARCVKVVGILVVDGWCDMT